MQRQSPAKTTKRGSQNNPMSENKAEVTLGAIVLAIAIGFVVYLSQSTGMRLSGDTIISLQGFALPRGSVSEPMSAWRVSKLVQWPV